MTEKELPEYLLSSAKRALRGVVIDSVRQVSVGYDEFRNLSMRVVYDGEPTEGEVEDMEVVTTEILADIPFKHVDPVEVVVSSAPMAVLSSLTIVVYERKE